MLQRQKFEFRHLTFESGYFCDRPVSVQQDCNKANTELRSPVCSFKLGPFPDWSPWRMKSHQRWRCRSCSFMFLLYLDSSSSPGPLTGTICAQVGVSLTTAENYISHWRCRLMDTFSDLTGAEIQEEKRFHHQTDPRLALNWAFC